MTVNLQQLRAIQVKLRDRVRTEPLPGRPRTVAAVDLHIVGSAVGVAAGVLWSLAENEMITCAHVTGEIEYPYVPGFLSFREAPLCAQALSRLGERPDVVLVDGQGIAHPRRFGLACHIGVELDVAAVGVAKSRLFGTAPEPGPSKGDQAPLTDGNESIGAVLRTRDRVKPLYISPGHRITIDESVDLVLSLCSRYRLPDPSRAAHKMASDLAREIREGPDPETGES